MTQFQSYIIVGPSSIKVGEKTAALAKSLGIDLKKVSPDIFIISPIKNLPRSKAAGSVTIEQIRELKSHIFQKPLKNKFKFIVIKNANLMTQEAQNALLKIFEEPPSQAIIVLETEIKESLLPTILSRAVIIKAGPELQAETEALIDLDLESALTKTAEVTDPKRFIDDQIIALTEKLINDIRTNQHKSALISTIEKYKEAKLMIAANVNPTFVLANLIISTTRQV